MKIIPSNDHRVERVIWIVALTGLLLTALFMVGLWE